MRFLSLLLALLLTSVLVAEPTTPRKIVLIAGPLDGGHPPGTHEYEKTVRAFKHCLENASNIKNIRVEAHLKGWPDKPATLDDADTIVVVSSGSDRNEKDHPLLVGERLATIENQMKRGCGLCLIHWATFMPRKTDARTIDWVGGYFDYESGPAKNGWYSKIQTVSVNARPGKHPITTGIVPFEIKDEFYYNIRFRERDPRLVPVLTVPIGKEGEQTVAWAVERADGGRGFGFTGGHFFENWRNENYRRLALNAILWTARAEVPDGGAKAEFPGDRELSQVTVGKPSQVLILTGHDGPFHNWRETSQVLKHVIERDGRMKCRLIDNPEFLAREDLMGYDLIVQNYVNWERPAITEAVRKNLLRYLESGRGLAVIHFANGAFHPSLPNAKDADWPEYRKIVRRVWDHGKGLSGHDRFGPFRVEIAGKHPITDGINAFDTVDELYYRQQGDMTLEPLVTALSKDTKQKEPLAWAYSYGKARVFQTVLGHSAESIRGDGPATLIRRGCTWAAQLELRPEKTTTTAEKPTNKLTFVDGRFGKGLDARHLPASIEEDERFRKPPFTVECWANLRSKDSFNVIVSTDPKSSGSHWEIYSYAGSGVFSAYLPGTTIGEIKSAIDICDAKWHHLAMSHDGKTVRLFVDGTLAKEQMVSYRPGIAAKPGPLMFGGAYDGPTRIGCDGVIDEVRISNVAREIKVPTLPLTRDANTISLWNLDGNEGISADTNWTPPIAADAQEPWQRETDKDWVDARFSKTDTGPYLNATIDYEGPKGKVRSYKGTAIKVGEKGEGTVLFDRNTLRLAAGWTGGFLNHSSRRFGLLNTPTPAGTILFTTSSLAGWADEKGNFENPHSPTGPLPREWAKFKGLYLHGQRTILQYTVAGTDVLETHSIVGDPKEMVWLRSLEVGAADRELRFLIAEVPPEAATIDDKGVHVKSGPGRIAFTIAQTNTGKLAIDGKGRVYGMLPPSQKTRRVGVVLGTNAQKVSMLASIENGLTGANVSRYTTAGPTRWNTSISTPLQRAADEQGPFAIDTFTIPYENPWNALFFVAGVDFLPNGSIAICTAHGDVWTVSESRGTLTWKRFATGLYQPLGVKIVDGKIFVTERGQLTRLHDTNQDGEADFYESFNADWHAGGGEHSYDTCLETDPKGNFYLFKTGDDHTPTGGCLLRIAANGKSSDVFSTGFRHPIGLGMSPDGKISGADQEGNWMPVTRLDMYKLGGFYGDMRTHHRSPPPTTYDEPLIWLPKEADNSAGGQVWVPKGQWGPLSGTMLHLSYGRCKAYAVLPDGDRFQAAAVDLGVKFLSGSARGRFHPSTGELFVVGLDGWQTAAQKDGSLQRVRYTGKALSIPTKFRVLPDGVELMYDKAIDPKSIADLGAFNISRCNYIWSANYGSKNWSVVDPKREGIDKVPVTNAQLSSDGKTLKLQFEMRPAMHMKVDPMVRFTDGTTGRSPLFTTIREFK